MSAAGFAGSSGDIVLTFSADFRQARQQYEQFKSEVERQPASLRFNTPGAAAGASTGPGGYVPPPAGPSSASPFAGPSPAAAAVGGAGTASPFVSQGNQFSSTVAAQTGAGPAGVAPIPIQAARAQAASVPFSGFRAVSASVMSGGTDTPFSGMPVADFFALPAQGQRVPGGWIDHKGRFSGDDGPAVALPPTVRAATQAATAVPVVANTGGGRQVKNRFGRSAAGSGDFQVGQIRAVASAFGLVEIAKSLQAGGRAQVMAAFADTSDEALAAQISGIDAQTGGFFGAAGGFALDTYDWLNAKENELLGGNRRLPRIGPQSVREMAMGAQFEARATKRERALNLDRAVTNVHREGTLAGPFGSRLADIQAGQLTATARITEEQESIGAQEAAIQKLNIPESEKGSILSAIRRRSSALNRRRSEIASIADFEREQAGIDLEDDIAGFGDEAANYQGKMTRGEVRRRAMLRRHKRTSGEADNRLEAAEQSAFDAAESYRTGERLKAAREEKTVAELTLNRQFLTADVQDIFDAGTRRAREALREGSAEESRVIRQTTAITMRAFGKNLIEGGTAEFVENPRAMDLTGTAANRKDDTAQALERIEKLLSNIDRVVSEDAAE